MTCPIITGPRTGTRWFTVTDSAGTPPHAAIRRLSDWINGYLACPHPQLGRPGPVCPFVKPAVAAGLLWAGFVPGTDLTAAHLAVVVDDMHTVFTELAETAGSKRPHALITVFPDLLEFAVIDIVHATHKTRFVDHGLMLGQFYPGCRQPGLWNPLFHPLDTPLPMLVARNMMTTDLPFLIGRESWIRAYLRIFAPGLPTVLRRRIAALLHYDGDAVAAITTHRRLLGNEPAR